MYSKIITAVVLSAAFAAPAMAGTTPFHPHGDCYRGKCGGPAVVTAPHGKAVTAPHGAAVTKPH